MRKPTEDFDNVIGKAAPKVARPPRPVSLKSTGKVKALEPLPTSDGPAKRDAIINDPSVRSFPLQHSRSHPSLAMSGGLAVIVLILLSAVFIGINEPGVEQADSSIDFAVDPAADQLLRDTLIPADEPLISDIQSTSSGLDNLTTTARPRRAKPRYRHATYRARQRRSRLAVVTNIVPTTLVIYPENGEIKTRIERQVSAVY